MPDYTITHDDTLYGSVPKYNPSYWKDIDGRKVPSSFAFKTKPGEDGLSVNIAALTTQEATAGNVEQFGVAAIPASVPLDLGYTCKHDPLPDNNAHALIMGDTNPIAKRLAAASAMQIG